MIHFRLGRFEITSIESLCLTVSAGRPGSRVPQVVVRRVRVVPGHGRERVAHPGAAGKVPGARPRAVVRVAVRRVLLQLHEGLDLLTNEVFVSQIYNNDSISFYLELLIFIKSHFKKRILC